MKNLLTSFLHTFNRSARPANNLSEPHLQWTVEEEEAFNLMKPTEYVPPASLRSRFTCQVREIIHSFVDHTEKNPHYFQLYP